ncbi:MAG: SLC13 family permease [Pseudomonadales bacterium]
MIDGGIPDAGAAAVIAAPGVHAIAVMALTVVALYLFSRERLPLEVTSLGLLAVLAVGFALFPYPGVSTTTLFAGFGHEALIAVCALMVIGQGLVTTGALEPVGRILARTWGRAPFLSFLTTLIVGAVLSAFVNNTPIVVLLLPILISVCLRTRTSATRVLMPMSFATIVGGMATTIGTSTNLLVVSVARDLGQPEIGIFDFVVPAAIGGGVAIVYLWLIAPRLLPERQIALENPSPRLFEARLHLGEDSPAVGRTLAEAKTLIGENMPVQRIRRGDTYLLPLPDVELKAGDRLRVRDTPQRLKAFEEALKATLYSGDQPVDDEHPLRAENQVLAEIAVVQGSSLDRTNLRFARFLDRYQLAVLAVHRAGRDIWRAKEELEDVILRRGDVLLVQGSREHIAALKESTDFLVLDATVALPSTSKAPIALLTLAVVVSLAATGILPIAVSATAGATLLLVTRTLGAGSAIRAISPSVFFVVAASLALSSALTATGAIEYITSVFLRATEGATPTVILSALMLMLAILTNVVSNNAAAVIGTPIAVGIATQLALPAEPFVLAVLFGANMSYATPMAYNTNLLVMSAGQYQFNDFVRVGVPLTLLMWLTLTWVLSTLYL